MMTYPSGSGYRPKQKMPWSNWSTRTRVIVGGVAALLVLGALFGNDPKPAAPLELRPAARSSVAPVPVDTSTGEPEVVVTHTVTVEPSVSSVTMPDVRGVDGAKAEEVLHQAGFSTVTFEAMDGRTVMMKGLWNVVRQVPEPRTETDPATQIVLQVEHQGPTPEPQPKPVKTRQPAQPEPTRQPPTKQAQPEHQPTPSVHPTEQTQPEHQPTPSAHPTDPRFNTCREANDNGYGDYVKEVNPEYDWYDDRDHDGIVCERS
ncbi:MAG: hypothetical protein JWQ95_4964 [Sphaerisporangium sp.]|jgi:hypothetical protein|nr:hypothetical protein [Sphaerisporangium sp.]